MAEQLSLAMLLRPASTSHGDSCVSSWTGHGARIMTCRELMAGRSAPSTTSPGWPNCSAARPPATSGSCRSAPARDVEVKSWPAIGRRAAPTVPGASPPIRGPRANGCRRTPPRRPWPRSGSRVSVPLVPDLVGRFDRGWPDLVCSLDITYLTCGEATCSATSTPAAHWAGPPPTDCTCARRAGHHRRGPGGVRASWPLPIDDSAQRSDESSQYTASPRLLFRGTLVVVHLRWAVIE